MNYERLPEGLRAGMMNYIDNGVLPGSFLQAVLSNNLTESFARADDKNRVRMFEIVSFMYNEAPASCWGSKEKVRKWVDRRGLNELKRK